MIQLAAIALATLAATGLIMMVRGLVGTVPPLASFAAQVEEGRPTAANRWGWLVGDHDDLDACLELVGMTNQQWRSNRLQWMALVGAFGATFGLLLLIFGMAPAVGVIVLAAAGVAAGWWLALLQLRSDAERARTEASSTVAVFLVLTQALMAAGAGTNSAMTAAASAGNGRVFTMMRHEMRRAETRGDEPWMGLGHLGQRLGIEPLDQLASSLRQASEGARVGDSLRSRSAALRARDRFDREAEMHAKSESMSLPLVLMALAFVVLIGYPAVELLLAI